MTPDPLLQITRTSQLAENIRNDRLAFTLTALSIFLVGTMALKEARSLFGTKNFDRDEASRHQRG